MVVTRSGPAGLSVPSHVNRELSVALVHVQTPHQQTVDDIVVDWDKLQSCKDVTHITAQVNIFSNHFYWTIKPSMQLPQREKIHFII